jgi:hypothetical protein
LTAKGRADSFLLGFSRRKDYADLGQKVLPHNFDPNEVLLVSSDYQRTEQTLLYFLQGLYPLGEGSNNPL